MDEQTQCLMACCLKLDRTQAWEDIGRRWKVRDVIEGRLVISEI